MNVPTGSSNLSCNTQGTTTSSCMYMCSTVRVIVVLPQASMIIANTRRDQRNLAHSGALHDPRLLIFHLCSLFTILFWPQKRNRMVMIHSFIKY
ncbi:hypothetical protein K439DRAFT_702873 [Ramaria rubella]|nr:hypothetical protein K439DRAFT_702873 [Ramaria rubella]